MRNIDIFESYSALLFAHLYEHFPLRVNVKAYDLAMKIDETLWDESKTPLDHAPFIHKYNQHKSPVGLAKPTIQWLKLAGLIDYEAEKGSEFTKMVLTPKGLESIKVDPDVEIKLLNAAKSILIDTSKETAQKELKEAFSGIISWCARNVPSFINSVSSLS
ncbi:hypothetical protein P5E07_23090 [Vibrio parahaemolyticus]|uniref:Uncharacterized protein n=1 Tax=Vibrio parahaemolyticus TaxID=670 RepID=A0A7Y0S542_VIBPH|nr:hypothetical protein [Vibrio parahaemolyticus]EJE4150215.1 hypothetical protein [Vibrio parahaemolyticus]ELU0552495.1 hypothetical protein [Vibrio parahaemolyticus]MCZ6279490.1 hypothetical protein [Vibrio parahaemolyticus]MDF5242364.1 hypothetical protein [Vibrio parahaemolyticus]MDF5495962.1 hypothetical protein [Vibrio parahaemolyticus]